MTFKEYLREETPSILQLLTPERLKEVKSLEKLEKLMKKLALLKIQYEPLETEIRNRK